MQKLEERDLWPLAVYQGVRAQFRREVIAAKQHRRVQAGPEMTLVFENRLTVKFQVQEILRIENITKPEGIREELEGFNTMIPEPGELSATLMIELQGPEPEVAAKLKQLSGLGGHVWLELGPLRIKARFDEGRDDGKRVSAVQYVRFPVGADRSAFANFQIPAALVVDHPNYRHLTPLTDEARRSLLADLEERAGTA